MLDEIDQDGTGEIDFAEFLRFVVSAREVEGKRVYTEKETESALKDRQFQQMLGFIQDKGLGEQFEKYVGVEQGVLVTEVLSSFRGAKELTSEEAALRLQKLFRRRQMRILLDMKPWTGEYNGFGVDRRDTIQWTAGRDGPEVIGAKGVHSISANPVAPTAIFRGMIAHQQGIVTRDSATRVSAPAGKSAADDSAAGDSVVIHIGGGDESTGSKTGGADLEGVLAKMGEDIQGKKFFI
jgi:hypothetical protein